MMPQRLAEGLKRRRKRAEPRQFIEDLPVLVASQIRPLCPPSFADPQLHYEATLARPPISLFRSKMVIHLSRERRQTIALDWESMHWAPLKIARKAWRLRFRCECTRIA